MKTSLNHQLHHSRLQKSSKQLAEVKDGAFLERQQIGVIGRDVRNEQLRFNDECLRKLGETADFVHQLRDYTVEQKPGVSESDEDLFATLQKTEQIATSVNQRWDAVTESTGPTTKPTTVIQTVRPMETTPMGA
jgi:hypothetical protein